MNSDRCYHIPTSPGQTVCTCLDYTIWLRFVIQTQADYIADLERRMHTTKPQLITRHNAENPGGDPMKLSAVAFELRHPRLQILNQVQVRSQRVAHLSEQPRGHLRVLSDRLRKIHKSLAVIIRHADRVGPTPREAGQ